MSILKSVYTEIIKALTTKLIVIVISVVGVFLSQVWTYYKFANNESRIASLESNFAQDIGIRTEITKFLTNCPSYTGLAWIEYSNNTGKILFKKVITNDKTIGIYDATTTNDLYSSTVIDKKTLYYFASLQDEQVYFIDEHNDMWEYGFFSEVRTKAWKFTNDKIKLYTRADYVKEIKNEHGPEGIQVLRLYNVVIKDKNRNLIYIISLALSGKNNACYNENKSMTSTHLLDLAAYIKDESKIV
jgi:hypothetical protein